MDKYYTPEIEEFYVGFEYENKVIDLNGKTIKWLPVQWTESCNMFGLFNVDFNGDKRLITVPDSIRVKYLSRDCIESLAWDHDYNAEPIPNREELPVFEGYLFDKQNETGELWILYHFSDNIVWIEYIKDCGGLGYVFKGEIKNKSELKKLLKQLGI